MMNIIYTGLISMLPIFELRAAIPYGILEAGLDWRLVLFVSIISNILIGFILIYILDFIVNFMNHFKWFDKLYSNHVVKLQKKYAKNIDLFGNYALILFIAVPIPGSGVYSASIISKTLNLTKKKYFLACIFGVILAGIVVTLLTVGIDFFL